MAELHLDKREVEPFFQPIVDLESMHIYGYEVLARRIDPKSGAVDSIGSIFSDFKECGNGTALQIAELDLYIQKRALEKLTHRMKQEKDILIFFNVMPQILSIIYQNNNFDINQFPLVKALKEYGVDPARIVIEITEDSFLGEMSHFIQIVQTLKDYGFKIAVDDLGSEVSNLTRLAFLHPDIIKVDLNMLRESLNRDSFRRLLGAISMVSQKLDAKLLFEGIEAEDELMASMKLGGQLLQGFLFSKAIPDFQAPELYETYLKEIMQEFSQFRIAELIQMYRMRDDFIKDFKKVLETFQLKSRLPLEEDIQKILHSSPAQVKIVTFFDFTGNQISDKYAREAEGSWTRKEAVGIHNISWRPYFQRAVAKYRFSGKDYYVSEPFQSRGGFPRYTAAFILEGDIVLLLEVEWLE